MSTARPRAATFRNFSAGLLLFLAALVVFSANLGVWINRTIYDSDGFVSTVNRTLDDPAVEHAVAVRFTDQLVIGAQIEQRLQEALPEGLRFLALPLTDAVRDLVTRVSLRVLQGDRIEALRDDALHLLHQQLITIINGGKGTVSATGDKIVINLRPVLDSVIEQIGLQDVRLGDQAGNDNRLLARLQLPPDAGQFVIQDKAVAWSYRIAHYGDDIIRITVGVAIGLMVLALLVATDRRSMLRNVGIMLIVIGVLSVVLLAPVRIAAREFAREPAAGVAVVNGLSEQFRYQSFGMMTIGFVAAGGAALAGPTRFARSLRAQVRSAPSAAREAGLAALVREQATTFRIIGLVLGAVLLIAWPDPTRRVYITLLGLLAAYLGAIWVMSSSSETAENMRQRLSAAWSRYFASQDQAQATSRSSWSGLIARRAPVLRAIGIVAVVLLLLVWPSPTLGSVIALVALLLAYLAAIDFIAKRQSGEDDADPIAEERQARSSALAKPDDRSEAARPEIGPAGQPPAR